MANHFTVIIPSFNNEQWTQKCLGSVLGQDYDRYWVGNIRMKPWTMSHLRTFRRELFLKIRYEDLLDEDEYFYRYTFDQAMMYPMAEMSGPEHFREIKQIMYVYNRKNPISVDRIYRGEQLRVEQQIRFKRPYERLLHL
jgi:hypothetical protein